MAKLAGTWKHVSTEHMEELAACLGADEELQRELAAENGDLAIELPDSNTVSIVWLGSTLMEGGLQKFGEVFDFETPTGIVCKAVLTKESETKIKAVQTDSDQQGQMSFELCQDLLFVTTAYGGVTAISKYRRA
ncbi:unnamed protein product [Calicophoron daubneyi]|uniref:Uncharacterized protein n=1 Tax=Calicophoron daubneyi TaxID=300641 RepID=A0AAV2T539_CALDB